jgi:hypothetical protein
MLQTKEETDSQKDGGFEAVDKKIVLVKKV